MQSSVQHPIDYESTRRSLAILLLVLLLGALGVQALYVKANGPLTEDQRFRLLDGFETGASQVGGWLLPADAPVAAGVVADDVFGCDPETGECPAPPQLTLGWIQSELTTHGLLAPSEYLVQQPHPTRADCGLLVLSSATHAPAAYICIGELITREAAPVGIVASQ